MLARLFHDLEAFQPTLVGTYPLGLHVDGSDFDIACTCDLPRGIVLVARDGEALVGHAQMIEDAAASTWELKSLAVAEAHRERGLGRRLVEAGLAHARSHDARAALDRRRRYQLLRFYQRRGFRLLRLERDVFTPEAGYPADLAVDGIPLRDRMWLDLTW